MPGCHLSTSPTLALIQIYSRRQIVKKASDGESLFRNNGYELTYQLNDLQFSEIRF